MPQSAKRPKLSLQTSILPQPVSPALPLPCSADTPTSRNTLANSFRSPLPEKQSTDRAVEKPGKENLKLPYSVESAKGGILKNTPLANLIRTRSAERRNALGKASIKFVEEPQLIPRPAEDTEMDSTEEEVENVGPEVVNTTSETAVSAPSSAEDSSRPGGKEWRRLRVQRSANEGRELRRGSVSTPITTSASSATPASPAPSDSSADSIPDYCPPQTPETPSPAQTRDWVWTLGNNFNGSNTQSNLSSTWGPYTPPDSGDNSRRSSEADGKNEVGSQKTPRPSVLTGPGVVGGRLPDTPKTATPITPITPARVALPQTPVSATEREMAAKLRLHTAAEPLTPRSVPLPNTPGPNARSM